MQEPLPENFFKGAKDVKMDEGKKQSIERTIFAFMKQNPVRPKRGGALAVFALFKFKAVNYSLAGFAAILIFGGVISANAESALPGDYLYAVKTGVNERVFQVLAFSDDQKTKLNMELIDRRLQEAEKLALLGKSNEIKKENVAQNLVSLAQKTEKLINKLNKNTYNLEAALRAHSQILRDMDKEKDNTVGSLADDIDKAVSGISESRIQLENKVFENPKANLSEKQKAVQEKIKDAKEAILQARKTFKEKNKEITKEVKAKTEESLQSAQEKISEIENNIESHNNGYSQARALINDAILEAKESKKLVEEKVKLRRQGFDETEDPGRSQQ